MKRERVKNAEYAKRRNISLRDSDYEIARAIGEGNASHGIKLALRWAIRLEQFAIEELGE